MKYLALEPQSEYRIGYQHLIKEQNIKHVFDLVRSGRCSSRAELVRAMHLSATTISALVEELQARGLILETGPSLTSLPGRRPMKLRLNHAGRQLAMFSLNRRGVRFTLFDLGCRVIENFFVDHPMDQIAASDPEGGYAKLFEDVLLRRSARFDPSNAVVIGVSYPGIYLADEQIFSIRAAMDVSFSEASMRDLQEQIGVPIFLGNTSMCLSYAEKKHIDAALDGEDVTRDLIFINICDGVGAGIISQGSIMTGPYSTAGEFGHISIDLHGRLCSCGNCGCLEQYVNQNAILRDVCAACAEAGEERPGCFADLAGSYDSSPAVRRVLDNVAEKLAIGIFTMMCATGIRRIVIGGGIEILGEGFLNRLRSCIQFRHMLTRHMQMSYACAGSDGDSIGLAHYFLDKVYSITLPDGQNG